MPVGCGALLKNGARDFLRSGCEDAGFLLKGAVFGVLRSEGAQVFFKKALVSGVWRLDLGMARGVRPIWAGTAG